MDDHTHPTGNAGSKPAVDLSGVDIDKISSAELDRRVDENIFQKIKKLFGPPPLLRNEKIEDYDLLLRELIGTFRPLSVFEMLNLKNLVLEEWINNRLRRLQTLTLEEGAKRFHDQQQRQRSDAQEKKDKEKALASELAEIPAEQKRVYEIENAIDEAENFAERMKSTDADVAYARALTDKLGIYAAIDALIRSGIKQLTDSARWIFWIREMTRWDKRQLDDQEIFALMESRNGTSFGTNWSLIHEAGAPQSSRNPSPERTVAYPAPRRQPADGPCQPKRLQTWLEHCLSSSSASCERGA